MSSTIWTRAFWQATAERVVATAAQAGIAYVGTSVFDVINFNWLGFAGVAGGGAVLSLLKSLAANGITQTGPSLLQVEQVVPAESPVAVDIQAAALPQKRDAQGRFTNSD